MSNSSLSRWQRLAGLASGTMNGLWQMQQANLAAASRSFTLMANTYSRLLGQPGLQILPADKRFKDDTWQENPAFDLLKQAYLIAGQWMLDMANGLEPIDGRLHQRARFWTQQMVDALSPSNFASTNPEVLRETLRTGGANLVRGSQNLFQDLQAGRLSLVPDDAFVVGKDLAITPGKVVFRNPLIEVMQYQAATEQVAAVPILVIPPWINKYYVMDMRPQNSLYKYLVDSGFTVFTISWKNPDSSVVDLTWEDYMDLGPLAALEVVKSITGMTTVNLVGYCLGGIMLQTILAYLAATGDDSVNSATYFATHQDFDDVGDIAVFLDQPQVLFLEWLMMASGGYLDGRNMAATFNMLRANDLLWPYMINNYLLGKEPSAFDLLYWNSDGTRVPGRVHSFLLREFFLDNKLKEPGGVRLNGVDIDLRQIITPTYTVAGSTDHIVPWQGAFQMKALVGGPVRLVLSEGGHIMGIINAPSRNKGAYWINEERMGSAEAWLAAASKHEGSWWPDWQAWLAERSGKPVAPPATGNESYPVIGDAPGTYVLEK